MQKLIASKFPFQIVTFTVDLISLNICAANLKVGSLFYFLFLSYR